MSILTKEVTAALLDDITPPSEFDWVISKCWCMLFLISGKQYHENRAERNFVPKISPRVRNSQGCLRDYEEKPSIKGCAAGPHLRYACLIKILTLNNRNPEEDDDDWFVPCFFVC